MQEFCRTHNRIDDYEPFFERWSDEEMANAAVTLCCMVDTMMQTYQKKKENEFVTEGGIKERMTAARKGYRTDLHKELEALRNENAVLRDRIDQLLQENATLRSQLK
jgi:four helix bundle suffix protein